MLNSISTRKIDRETPIPYYYQIVQILREVIQDQAAVEAESADAENTLFPSETELSETFQVNRGTIRHALEVLEREGLIYREKGRGTFLQRKRVELDLTRLCSTTEDLKSRGWEPSSRVIECSLIQPGAHIRRFLKLKEEEPVWQVFRLRLANGEPISLQRSYIPIRFAPALNKKHLEESIYYILKNDYGIELKTADQTIRARSATPEEALMLGIAEGEAIFEISRVSYDSEGRPIEHLDSLWRGDRYDFHVRLFNRD